MIFAQKLIELRKKAGLTQEELAEKMEVSRQSIAKWEGAQSVPELSKLIRLSELFGVSTDYLLKDEMEAPEPIGEEKLTDLPTLHRVSMAEANAFLAARRKAATPMAIATVLCILAPVLMILLGAMTEAPAYPISDGLAAGLGMTALLLFAATAVAIFLAIANKNAPYAYLETEPLDTEYGITGMVKERRASFKPVYDRCNLIGTIFCIFSVLPIFLGVMISEDDPILMGAMVCLLFPISAVGVFLFVRVGVIWGSFERLLEEGAYTQARKREKHTLVGTISGGYWMLVTAIYLVVSFGTDKWKVTWIVWAVAGTLYPVLLAVLRAAFAKEKTR